MAHRRRRWQTGLIAAGLGAAAVVGATGCGSDGSDAAPAAASPAQAAKPTPPPPKTRLARHVRQQILDGTKPVTVTLAGQIAPGTPHPRLSPHVAGHWTLAGKTERFQPTTALMPCADYTLTVPGTTTVARHRPLGHAHHFHLDVRCPSTRATQLALARLRYLPYQAQSSSGEAMSGSLTRHAAAKAAFHPRGHLEHSISEAPTIDVGSLDAVTKGALMAFQSDHGLDPDGAVGQATWKKLLAAVAGDDRNESRYTWVTVEKGSSERLTVHRGSDTVVSSPTNTGVSGAETPDGTFPIFERLPVTTMKGTNPDGSQYDDPGVKWVNYFTGGDAVHAFQRGSYGTPQSNGCVELPEGAAARAYQALHIGDPVVVTG